MSVEMLAASGHSGCPNRPCRSGVLPSETNSPRTWLVVSSNPAALAIVDPRDPKSGEYKGLLATSWKQIDDKTLSRNDGVVDWPTITAIAESPVKAGVYFTDESRNSPGRRGIAIDWRSEPRRAPIVARSGRSGDPWCQAGSGLPRNRPFSSATRKLSKATFERCTQAEAMTLDEVRRDLRERDHRRAAYQALAAEFDACITLAASGAAPVGLGGTGDPTFAAPGSMLGVPAISLPALQDDCLPLGLQLLGFADRDAELFSTAGGVLAMVK